MRKELDNFIIESDTEIDYFDDIVNHVIENERRILDFFGLDHLEEKVIIKIMGYDNFVECYKEKNMKIFGYERGLTDNSNTIRLLTIDDQLKYTTHKDANLEEFKGTLLHEITHKCQKLVHDFPKECVWFSEGLAIYLANQSQFTICSLDDCDFDKLVNGFNSELIPNKYPYSYTIFNYIINNYDKTEIDELIRDPFYLIEKQNTFFEEAKEYYKRIGSK